MTGEHKKRLKDSWAEQFDRMMVRYERERRSALTSIKIKVSREYHQGIKANLMTVKDFLRTNRPSVLTNLALIRIYRRAQMIALKNVIQKIEECDTIEEAKELVSEMYVELDEIDDKSIREEF